MFNSSTPGLILGDASSNLMIDQLFNGALKFIFILAFFLYVIFAFIATRQIDIMRKTVQTSFSPWLRIIGIVHFGLAVAVLVLFILV